MNLSHCRGWFYLFGEAGGGGGGGGFLGKIKIKRARKKTLLKNPR